MGQPITTAIRYRPQPKMAGSQAATLCTRSKPHYRLPIGTTWTKNPAKSNRDDSGDTPDVRQVLGLLAAGRSGLEPWHRESMASASAQRDELARYPHSRFPAPNWNLRSIRQPRSLLRWAYKIQLGEAIERPPHRRALERMGSFFLVRLRKVLRARSSRLEQIGAAGGHGNHESQESDCRCQPC